MIDYATYQRIQHLHHVEKLTVTQIAHAVPMDARTVRRWLDEPQFRARATPAPPSKLDPYKGYIRRLLEHHPYSAAQLLNRLREAGYDGTLGVVAAGRLGEATTGWTCDRSIRWSSVLPRTVPGQRPFVNGT